jgi:hypothetical protein
MVSFFQGLGLAAGSFSDVIEEKQKQRDLTAREERIAKRDRAWQVEDFEKKAELVRKKEESERLRKEEEAERASLAYGRVAGIPPNEWNNTPLALRKQFQEQYDSLNPDGFTPGEWWNLSYRNGSFKTLSLPKDEEVTKSSLIGQNWATYFNEKATREERDEALQRIRLMETSDKDPDKPKTLSDVVTPYYKLYDRVNENRQVNPTTGQVIIEPSAQEVLSSNIMENKFDLSALRTMKNVFRTYSNEANASNKMIRIAYEMGQEQDRAKYTEGKDHFDREQVEQTLNTQTNISNLVAAVTEVKSFVDSNKQVSGGSPLAPQFNALAVSNENNLKAFLPRVYLSGISTIEGIGAYMSTDKTYQTFFNGKVVPFKIEMDRGSNSLFFKVNGKSLDSDNPLAKYIMLGPGAN